MTTMAAKRAVLVSYNGRNKLLSVPPTSSNRTDLQYLDNECRKLFSFCSNVHISLTFQKFDPEWDMNIDLEADYIAMNKDKLNMIVTPLIVDNSTPVPSVSSNQQTDPISDIHLDVTPTVDHSTTVTGSSGSSSSTEVVSNSSVASIIPTPCRSKSMILQKRPTTSRSFLDSDDDEEEHDNTSQKRRANLLDDSDEGNEGLLVETEEILESLNEDVPIPVDESCNSSSSAKSLPVCVSLKPKKLVEKSLPDPYPLPENFHHDIELALKTKKMSRETTRRFYSHVASSMLCYKHYPTKEEYTRVAVEIIRKYPFMKPRSNRSPTEAIVETLINRFKQFNRKKKSSSKVDIPKSSKPAEKKVSTTPQYQKKVTGVQVPEIPPGEDDASFERTNNRIKAEWKKSKVNAVVIEKLADSSFAMRRRDILENPKSLEVIYRDYPFLKTIDQVYMEMGRIFNQKNLVKTVREMWTETASKILDQVDIDKESNSRLRNTIQDLLPKNSSEYNRSIAALCFLAYLLPDARMRANHELVLYFCPDSQAHKEIAREKGQVEPYILIIGRDLASVESAFLVIDCQVRYEVDLHNVVFSLLSSFFVFNICYCKGTCNLFQFLEVVLLDQNPKKLNPSVNHLLSMI